MCLLWRRPHTQPSQSGIQVKRTLKWNFRPWKGISAHSTILIAEETLWSCLICLVSLGLNPSSCQEDDIRLDHGLRRIVILRSHRSGTHPCLCESHFWVDYDLKEWHSPCSTRARISALWCQGCVTVWSHSASLSPSPPGWRVSPSKWRWWNSFSSQLCVYGCGTHVSWCVCGGHRASSSSTWVPGLELKESGLTQAPISVSRASHPAGLGCSIPSTLECDLILLNVIH